MRQVQAFAMTSDERQENEDDEREERKQLELGRSAAQWRTVCSISRNLEDTGEDDAQRGASFCTVLFPSTFFFACSHVCCLVVCFFYLTFVSKAHTASANAIVLLVRDVILFYFVLLKPCVCWLYKVKTVPLCSLLRLWEKTFTATQKRSTLGWFYRINQGIGFMRISNVYIIPNIYQR